MNIFLEADGKRYSIPAELVTAPVPNPVPPVPTPTPTGGKWVFLNCINWKSLDALPLAHASEFGYFVLPVSTQGALIGTDSVKETKFVANVKGAGKKPTFSLGGGTQGNFGDIGIAITTNRTAFINNIASHLTQFGYMGVTLDIENTTNISAQTIVDFIKALRVKFDALAPNLIIGVYTQNYQKELVWAKIDQAKDAITWLACMTYDMVNTVEDFKRITLEWLPKVGGDKNKLLAGAAVNYDTTGLNLTELSDVLDWINVQGLGGIAIWQNDIYIQSYRDLVKKKFPVIQ